MDPSRQVWLSVMVARLLRESESQTRLLGFLWINTFVTRLTASFLLTERIVVRVSMRRVG